MAKKVEILITNNKEKYHAAMAKLNETDIKYYTKVIDNGGSSFGMGSDANYNGHTYHHVYEISVRVEDEEEASYIIHRK